MPAFPFRLGINHHLLFPLALTDPEEHSRTLPEVLAYPEFDLVDLFVSGDPEQREREATWIRESGKAVVYNCPMLAQLDGCDPHSHDPRIVENTRRAAVEQLDLAARVGAEKIVVASGPKPPPDRHEREWSGWVNFLAFFGREAGERGLRVVLEPFDQSIGKNLLIGPTEDGVRCVEEVRSRGVDSVGLMVDMGHLAVMEETFEHALRLSAPYLGHIHLGSAVTRYPDHPWYGDCHPPLELPEGEHDRGDLRRFLELLVQIGYLDDPRATVTLEMRPYPGSSARESVSIWLDILSEVWTEIEAAPRKGATT